MKQEFSVYEVDTGRIVSALVAYSDDERDANVPTGMSWIAGFHDPFRYYVVNGAPVEYPPRPADHFTFDYQNHVWIDSRGAVELAAKKSSAIIALNNYIRGKRIAFVTDLPGQEMIYMRKEEEGRRYLDLPQEPEDLTMFPLMAAEVGITAPTPYQLATIWVQLSSIWLNVAAALESVRISMMSRIQSASTFEEIDALMVEIAEME